MDTHPLAGKPAPRSILVNIPQLITAYYLQHPDPAVPEQRVAFGTSGHRGSSLALSFNEDHIVAIVQAICDYRRSASTSGPLYLGVDTHALSEPTRATAIEVLTANNVTLMKAPEGAFTPTPVISHAVLSYNRGRRSGHADGIVITPSHNPPEDGGIKYNPPHGGPADTSVTRWIEERANLLLAEGVQRVQRLPYGRALKASCVHDYDYATPYVADLRNVIDMDAIRSSALKIGVDPMGGASVAFWAPIAEEYQIDVEVVNEVVDPTFAFMSVDKDGRIRTDCSSPYAMARLIGLKENYDIAFGNDADCDRHGIVTRSTGLMNPNHYLAAAIWYLIQNRPAWKSDAVVGKTLVSSSMIDKVTARLGRTLWEVPVGFKWFVERLVDGSCVFGGEESAGASFLRMDGTVWTTDKDGFIPDLLAAEITAKAGKDPGEVYRDRLVPQFGEPSYERIDRPTNPRQKQILSKLSPEQVKATTLGGDPIIAKLTKAPGNDAAIGGLKVATENGWFAARPSGTENVYKVYAESFKGAQHLSTIIEEAMTMLDDAFRNSNT